MTALRAGLVAFAKAALFRVVAFPAMCGLVWWLGDMSSFDGTSPRWLICVATTLGVIGAGEVIIPPFTAGLFAWLHARREDQR
ncbi:hypothetical protein ACFSDD_11250 [Salipiger marinus]|uniref:hypothetical protein n=1 Tax=Salipiger marinus TaxID=555512 RepID=UPI002CE1F322|nr:hypothetical protein [Salipiger manganoxidans]MEB3419948.1 hypothetical protein [Salipiger manganoxidans]